MKISGRSRLSCIPTLFLVLIPFNYSLHVAPTRPVALPQTNLNSAVSTYSRTYTAWNNSQILYPRGGVEQPPLLDLEHRKELSYDELFAHFRVKPPLKVHPKIWRWCYHVNRASLRLLHLFDPLVVPNSSLSGLILWWKALVGNDHSSPAYDQGWAYDLLPRRSRWVVKWGRVMFPRLNHANIELRTGYLNEAVEQLVSQQQKSQKSAAETGYEEKKRKVRMIVLGAGYDLRGTRLLTEGKLDAVVELDLPEVITAKKALLTQRLKQRRKDVRIPQFEQIDLNDAKATQMLLHTLISDNDYYNIIVLEGIMVHLKVEAGCNLLSVLSSCAQAHEAPTDLVFADALPHVTNRRLDEAISELRNRGWILLQYFANPTKAPHMGLATPALSKVDARTLQRRKPPKESS